jgi:hypothetical protein
VDVSQDLVVTVADDGEGSTCTVLTADSYSAENDYSAAEFPYNPQYQNVPLLTADLELQVAASFTGKKINSVHIVGPGLVIHHQDGSLETKTIIGKNGSMVDIPNNELVSKVQTSRNSAIIVTEFGKVYTWSAVQTTWKPQGLMSLFRGSSRQILDPGMSLWDCINSRKPLFVSEFKDVLDVAVGWDQFIISTK